jgi:proteasome inhibitor subunit 1 (PI31)
MTMDPSHPFFTQPFSSSSSPFGGNQRLPPGAVPPGVRFDPITPLGPRPAFPARPLGRGSFQPGSPWRFVFFFFKKVFFLKN